MKKLTIVRHSRLEPPYDNYDLLDYKTICRLATGEIDPGINKASSKLIEDCAMLEARFDVIYCSNSNRAIATAGLIKKIKSLSCDIRELEQLREINFDVNKLVSPKVYSASGLNSIRKTLYQTVIASGQGVEKMALVQARLLQLEKIIINEQRKNILMISHGFFMRFMYFFLLNKKDFVNSVLTSELRFDYLNGFSLEV